MSRPSTVGGNSSRRFDASANSATGVASYNHPSGCLRGADRRILSASFSSLMAGPAATTAQTCKIEKKLPFGTTGNRNL